MVTLISYFSSITNMFSLNTPSRIHEAGNQNPGTITGQYPGEIARVMSLKTDGTLSQSRAIAKNSSLVFTRTPIPHRMNVESLWIRCVRWECCFGIVVSQHLFVCIYKLVSTVSSTELCTFFTERTVEPQCANVLHRGAYCVPYLHNMLPSNWQHIV